MDLRFAKHYTRDEAQALLPRIREWLKALNSSRQDLEKYDKRLNSLMSSGQDAGGSVVNNRVRSLADIQGVLAEFRRRQILIKDLDRGLVDFPAVIGGKEVFLCWEQEEDAIEYWHDLDSGYSGRERL